MADKTTKDEALSYEAGAGGARRDGAPAGGRRDHPRGVAGAVGARRAPRRPSASTGWTASASVSTPRRRRRGRTRVGLSRRRPSVSSAISCSWSSRLAEPNTRMVSPEGAGVAVRERRRVGEVAAAVRPGLPRPGREVALDAALVAGLGVLVDVRRDEVVDVGALLAQADEPAVVGEHADPPGRALAGHEVDAGDVPVLAADARVDEVDPASLGVLDRAQVVHGAALDARAGRGRAPGTPRTRRRRGRSRPARRAGRWSSGCSGRAPPAGSPPSARSRLHPSAVPSQSSGSRSRRRVTDMVGP